MASFLPTTAELEFMRSHLECPICYEIPRDGVMFQCSNGHNVCATCKGKLDANRSKCPQGRCNYLTPPAKNWTVAGLIADLPFEFPCKFAKATGGSSHSSCEFKGTSDMLKSHEAVCKNRSAECCRCKELVSAEKMAEHFLTVHAHDKTPVKKKPDVRRVNFLVQGKTRQ